MVWELFRAAMNPFGYHPRKFRPNPFSSLGAYRLRPPPTFLSKLQFPPDPPSPISAHLASLGGQNNPELIILHCRFCFEIEESIYAEHHCAKESRLGQQTLCRNPRYLFKTLDLTPSDICPILPSLRRGTLHALCSDAKWQKMKGCIDDSSMINTAP